MNVVFLPYESSTFSCFSFFSKYWSLFCIEIINLLFDCWNGLDVTSLCCLALYTKLLNLLFYTEPQPTRQPHTHTHREPTGQPHTPREPTYTQRTHRTHTHTHTHTHTATPFNYHSLPAVHSLASSCSSSIKHHQTTHLSLAHQPAMGLSTHSSVVQMNMCTQTYTSLFKTVQKKTDILWSGFALRDTKVTC